MTKETAVLQVGIKGADIVMSALNKANALKDKFSKSSKGSISSNGGASADMQKQQQEQSKLGDSARVAGEGLKSVAQGMASLNPAQLMSGIAQASANALASIAPIGGDAIKAVGEATGMIIQAGTGAMNAIKNAQGSAIDTMEKRGRQAFMGGEKIFGAGGGGTNLSLSEQAHVLDSVTSKFGKVGDKFGASIKRLLDAGKDVSQVTAIASGNTAALGTNEGFFLNKITSQFSNLPPEMAQELMSQIADSINPNQLQNDLAGDFRSSNKGFEEAERNKQINIAKLAGQGTTNLNDTLNRLETTMVTNASMMGSHIAKFGNIVNGLLSDLPTVINKAESGTKSVGAGASYIYNALTHQDYKNGSKKKQ